MPSFKRRRSKAGPSVYAKRAKTIRSNRALAYSGMSRNVGRTVYGPVRRALAGVQRLNSMIETKESTQVTGSNLSLPHNNIYETGVNPFAVNIGASDPMSGTGNRIGDKISLSGVLVKGFFENALSRSRVHYRVMLVRGAKGETFNRANLFKGIVNNKCIDQMNTERFTIVASKRFTINSSNSAAIGADAAGQPIEIFNGTTLQYGGQATRAWQMWIPGRKFGRNGNITYENASTSQVKFYDYRIVILAYDWYGTPQDINNVGKINEMYCKLYFKDA